MRNLPSKFVSPSVTIRVAGSLAEGHLTYLDQLVSSAIDCALWPLLDLARLEEVDHAALVYLGHGRGSPFRRRRLPGFDPRVDAVREGSSRRVTTSLSTWYEAGRENRLDLQQNRGIKHIIHLR